jgi:hypothetical protein
MAADEAHADGCARQHRVLGVGRLFFFGVEAAGVLEQVDGAVEGIIVLGHVDVGVGVGVDWDGWLAATAKKVVKSVRNDARRDWPDSSHLVRSRA